MSKSFYSLGLMSGTSMDGVDVSIINSDGNAKFKGIRNQGIQILCAPRKRSNER